MPATTDTLNRYWTDTPQNVLLAADTPPTGLSTSEAASRANRGTGLTKPNPFRSAMLLLLAQFSNPIILILIVSACLSLFLKDTVDAAIILLIVAASGLLGFWQERTASAAVQKLLLIVQVQALCLRDGVETAVPTNLVVRGDIVIVRAGSIIPADCRILESQDLFVNEAQLTGETFPAEKQSDTLPDSTPMAHRSNCLFMGTSVVSGTASAIAIDTGRETEFGKVSETLSHKSPETEFEKGIRKFGLFLMELTFVLVLVIFATNVYFHRPVFDSFQFSLALAVGLTPQLLPAIISINLAHGAKRMAGRKVIVKRLSAIENLGSMDVLCTDKTGTITNGTVAVKSALDVYGRSSDKTLLFAAINAAFQTGYTNPIDTAILAYSKPLPTGYKKLDEEPYDFIRKRLSILVSSEGRDGEPQRLMVTKGALSNVLEACAFVETSDADRVPLDTIRAAIQTEFERLSSEGYRTLGIAFRDLGTETKLGKNHECEMTFVGFLVLYDPLQPGIEECLQSIRRLGISLKLITGDNALVAATIGKQAGMVDTQVITGVQIQAMSQEALVQKVQHADIFAEVEPNQKERIIVALRQGGHVVGYMGDGINDASALHAADVGISVANAVDVAKEAAEIVLLEKDLVVLAQGVREGRLTFANTLKYVFMATSANFGNMFSMAGASLFLSFLPMLPKQILFSNLITDFPEMAIATDSVDPEAVLRPRRWNIGFIRRFMIVFGLANSMCDFFTFWVLLHFMHATHDQFRTGWFVENVVTASLIVLVIRTQKRFFQSRPSSPLLVATAVVVTAVLAFPYTPLAPLFGLVPLPGAFLLALALIMVLYIAVAETAKTYFYRSHLRQ